MLSSTILSMVLAATAAYAAPAPAPAEPAIVAQLLTTALEVDRISLINSTQGNDGFIFDFGAKAAQNVKDNKAGLGGQAVTADAAAFPFLIGGNVAMAVGFMEPCGLNTAHSHKGNEFLVLVDGAPIKSQFEFNNKAPVSLDIKKFQGTLFPQDSIHTQFNPSCDPATFVSGFDTIDPSVNRAAPGLFGLNVKDVEATLGFTLNRDQIELINKKIPTAFAEGRQECLKRCNIKN
jgi:Cupin